MRWIKKGIRRKNIDVLDISSTDTEEINEMGEERKNVSAVQMQLNEMHLLSFFPNAKTLILTGGIPDEKDFLALYSNNQIRELVLDYEETDSDEEGIQLEKISNLEYVLSRSNLNIRSSDMAGCSVSTEILNYYKNGKPRKITIPPSIEICTPGTGIFFSTEAQTPAAVLLMDLLNKIDSYLIKNDFMISRYTDDFDHIAIIPVCMSQEMIDRGFYKERKYVSIKKGEADIRLHLDYIDFIDGTENKRRQMCYENIKKAGEYIYSKSQSFNLQLFLADIKTAICMNYES